MHWSLVSRRGARRRVSESERQISIVREGERVRETYSAMHLWFSSITSSQAARAGSSKFHSAPSSDLTILCHDVHPERTSVAVSSLIGGTWHELIGVTVARRVGNGTPGVDARVAFGEPQIKG
jgi:hypothetical protein